MASLINQIIVKTGKESDLSFSHSTAHRVITSSELLITAEKIPDCHLVIIECLQENEEADIKKFVDTFTSKENNLVMFYITNVDDEISNGFVDENGYDVYMSKEEMFKDIYNKTGLILTTDIKLRRELMSTVEEDADDPWSAGSDIFTGNSNNNSLSSNLEDELKAKEEEEKRLAEEQKAREAEEARLKKEKEEAEKLEAEHKKQEEIAKREAEERARQAQEEADRRRREEERIKREKEEADRKEKQRLEDEKRELERQKREEELQRAIALNNDKAEASRKLYEDEINRLKEDNGKLKDDNNKLRNDMSDLQIEADDLKIKLSDTELSKSSLEEQVESLKKDINTLNEEIDKSKERLSELNENNSDLSEALKFSEEKAEKFDKLRKSIEDKYNLVISKYNELIESDEVIEDPISLAEYQDLQGKIDEANQKSIELQHTIERKNTLLNDKDSEIEKLKAEIDEQLISISEKQSEIDDIQRRIDDGEVQSEELEKSKEQIKELNEEIENLEFRVKSQTKEIDNLRNKIDTSNEKAEKENESRKNSLEFSSILIDKVHDLNDRCKAFESSSEQQLELIKKLQSSDKGNSVIIDEQTAEIVSLRKKLEGVDKQIERAVANERYQKNELQKQLKKLQDDYTNQSEQLELREEQYKRLQSVSTVDEDGANLLEEENKTLKAMTDELRRQVAMSQQEIEKSRKAKVEAEKTTKQQDEQIKQLRTSLRAMSSGLTGNMVGGVQLPKIDYQGKGMIISVFGCGSFGITTTAMSIAQRLAQTSKVVYVDLDLVAPKADSWFKMNPMCKGAPGYNPSNGKYSTLGLFFEAGMRFVIQNQNTTVFKIDSLKTRNGSLDYFSGCYTKVEPMKLVSANFSELLTYLGNTYQYVIIDMGRLGSSDVNDKVIKVISDASFKSVVVTTTNLIEIRNFRMKLNENLINVEKVAWLLNMCMSTKMDDKVKRFTTPARVGMMPFDSELYGTQTTFIKSSKTAKDKIEAFLNNSVFV